MKNTLNREIRRQARRIEATRDVLERVREEADEHTHTGFLLGQAMSALEEAQEYLNDADPIRLNQFDEDSPRTGTV